MFWKCFPPCKILGAVSQTSIRISFLSWMYPFILSYRVEVTEDFQVIQQPWTSLEKHWHVLSLGISTKNLPGFSHFPYSSRLQGLGSVIQKKGNLLTLLLMMWFVWKLIHLIAHQTSQSLCSQTGDGVRRPHRNFVFMKPGCKATIFSCCTSAHDKLFLCPLIHILLFFKNISCFLSLVLLEINPCQDSAVLSGGQHCAGWPLP